jgi:hypothetical protein
LVRSAFREPDDSRTKYGISVTGWDNNAASRG